MTLQVIGAGFGRTGTMSLKVALEALGFGPCYHMIELFEHPEHAPQWLAATRGEPADWDAVFRGCRAAVDWPASAFYRQLLQAYPDAKVVLTVRDPDRWYDSALRTIYEVRRVRSRSRPLRLGNLLMPPGMRAAAQVVDELIWDRTFSGAFEDRRRAIEVYQRHNEQVKRHVPADRLLVYQPGDGWEPLCAFLGVEVPQGTPFPHLNDAEAFRSQMRARLALTRAVPIVAAILVGLAAAGLGVFARRLRLRRGPAA